MTMTTQLAKPKSMMSNKFPNINLKKECSFSKKKRPKTAAFIRKYVTEAMAPISGEWMAVRFIKIIKIVAYESSVKKNILLRAINFLIPHIWVFSILMLTAFKDT